ncbi:MAG: phosphatidate cytidylyltransferase [Spirochaetales bacterium]|nr:phosphatidate cytidylyltransferase [Spirochaetales bacterium]
MINNNNIIQRVLLFVIAIPLIAAAIFFLPQQKHIFFNIITVIASYISSKELINMLSHKGIKLNSKVIPFLSLPLPITSYLIVRFNLNSDIFSIVLTSLILLILLIAISTKKSDNDFSNNVTFSATSLFLIIYPGYFISYIVRFSEFENASLIICFFILIVFLNDSAAWLFGVLFGKNNRGVVKVSKNKSVMGFLGGTVGTFVFMGLAKYLIPELKPMPIISYIILSSLISLVTITGDLVESAIKRSCNVKDSGNIIMGRGGLLDSIDSLLLAAPFFYYIVKVYSEKGF